MCIYYFCVTTGKYRRNLWLGSLVHTFSGSHRFYVELQRVMFRALWVVRGTFLDAGDCTFIEDLKVRGEMFACRLA